MDIFDKESKLTENMFDGSFNKKKKYCSKDYWDNRIYKEKNYLKAEKDIVNILSKKQKYNVYDVCQYFAEKYYAVQIPVKYDIPYRDTSNFQFGLFSSDKFINSSTKIYDTEFNCTDDKMEDGEESILLMVDLYNNKTLHDKYPDVKQIYNEIMEFKRQQEQKGNSSYYQFNTLISITSYDRLTINSINVIEGVSPIEDINYEIWYFYNHS